MQKIYIAGFLNPDKSFSFLYVYTRQEDAEECVKDYCHVMKYDSEKGYVPLVLPQYLYEDYCAITHSRSFKLKVGGTWLGPELVYELETSITEPPEDKEEKLHE